MKKHILSLLVCAASLVQMQAQEFVRIGEHVIPVSAIKRIASSYEEEAPASLSRMLQEDEKVTLFTAALEATGWIDSLKCYIDENYSVGLDSVDWTNDALVIPVTMEYDNVAYMYHRYIAHTLFVESDATLAEKYGIKDLNALRAKAHELYDPMYPEDASVTDETDTRNALNRFVAYHILPFKANYYQLTCVDGGDNTLANNWEYENWDIADWYETCMPYSIMKLSYPLGAQAGLYINRRGVQSHADERGVFVEGTLVIDPFTMEQWNYGVNGAYYYIDDIIAYDQQTQKVVLDERMRIDCSTLSPDFITSGARGHETKSLNEYGKYGTMDMTANHNNKNTCLGFKAGAAKNFEFNDYDTHLHVRPRTLSSWLYQGDEVAILGNFDVTVKIPPVPKGEYELRLGTIVNIEKNGLVQFYIDDVPQGEPVDMRPNGTSLFGWKSDASLGNEEAITAFDKEIHSKGWMKGPKSYYSAWRETGGGKSSCFRDMSQTVRRVIGHFTSDGKTEHYMRFKQMLESSVYGSSYILNFDYIEIVPASVYNNDTIDEDRW